MSTQGHPFETQDVPLSDWLKRVGFIPGETVWMCTAAKITIGDFKTAASRDHTVRHYDVDQRLTDVLELKDRTLTGGHPVWKGTLQAPAGDDMTQDQHILATVRPAGQVVVFLQVINGREDNRANALPRVMECRH